MKRSSRVRLIAACVSTLLALAAIEVGLRVVGYAPLAAALDGKGQVLRTSDDPDLRYELTPSSAGHGWGTYVEVNSRGFRDTEYPLAKGDRRRIVVVGDSITFGNHLELERTYSERLESALNRRGQEPPIDVLNLGVGGYDTAQEVAQLERIGLQFEPDLVVVGFCVNDLGIVSVTMDHSWSEDDRENPLYLSRIAQGCRSFLGERRRRREAASWGSDDVYARAFADEIATLDDDPALVARMEDLRDALRAARDEPTAGPVLARRIPPRWYTSPTRVGRFRWALDRLAELSREHGFSVVITIVPYLDEEPLFAHSYGIVRHLAEARSMAVIEAEEEFRGVGLAELRIDALDPVHPDERGHAILAEKLEGFVRGLGWRQPGG